MFSWVQFLNDHNVDYVAQGSNVARGHINIQCPFCGEADPSHHMGLHLEKGWWACWKDSRHRGRDPARLIAGILGCSTEAARKLAEGEDTVVPDSWAELRGRLASVGQEPASRPQEEEIAFPKVFRPAEASPRFLRYLEGRGFEDPVAAAKRYQLQAALSGDFRYRLIIPFYLNSILVGWTGRAITPAVIRYKSLILPSVRSRLLFNADSAGAENSGRVLCVCEGPLDALKLDCYGSPRIRAVALLGLNLTAGKVSLLEELAVGYREVRIYLDRGETATSLRFLRALAVLRVPVRLGLLPAGIKDPGDLTRRQVRDITSSLTTA